MIKVIKTNAAMLKEFPILKDTLLYTIDTKETYFDLNNTERMQIKTGIQYRDENQIFAAINPSPNKIFISKKTNKIYRRSDKRFEEITDRTNRITALGSAMGAVDLSKTPPNKFRVGAGVGHSAKNQAVAVGIGYAPTERLRLNTKISTTTNSTKSNRSNGISIGASYDLDW